MERLLELVGQGENRLPAVLQALGAGFKGRRFADQHRTEGEAQNAAGRFLEAFHGGAEELGPIGRAGSDGDDRGHESCHLPGIGVRAAPHEKPADPHPQRHGEQEQPALLREPGHQAEGHQGPGQAPEHPQPGLLQSGPGWGRGKNNHGDPGPEGFLPVHGQGDAVGEHEGEACSHTSPDVGTTPAGTQGHRRVSTDAWGLTIL